MKTEKKTGFNTILKKSTSTTDLQFFNFINLNAVIWRPTGPLIDEDCDFKHFLNIISSLKAPQKFCLDDTNIPQNVSISFGLVHVISQTTGKYPMKVPDMLSDFFSKLLHLNLS